MQRVSVALVLRTDGVRWPVIVLGFVLLEVACFYASSLLATGITYFAWMGVNIGALVFGPVIWREHQRSWRRAASFTERQAERQHRQTRRKGGSFSEREEEWCRLEELQREAQRQEATRQRQAERQIESAQRWQSEQGREVQREHQRERQHGTARSRAEWWRTLELAPSASKEEIARSYRRKVQQCHPDKVAGLSPEFLQLAEQRTKALNQAYEQAMRTSR